MALLDIFNIGDSGPEYSPPEMNPGTVGAIREYSREALADDPSKIYDQTMKGTSLASGMMAPDRFNQNLGYSNPTSDAIRSKVGVKHGQRTKELEFRTKLDSRNMYFSKLQTAADLASQEVAINEQIRVAKYKNEMARRAARGQLMGTLLGMGGMIAGFYAGGPMGAMAGGAAGQAAGQEMGGG